jgi:hypothetical protein
MRCLSFGPVLRPLLGLRAVARRRDRKPLCGGYADRCRHVHGQYGTCQPRRTAGERQLHSRSSQLTGRRSPASVRVNCDERNLQPRALSAFCCADRGRPRVNAIYSIAGGALPSAGTIDFYWATGPAVSDEIGKPFKVATQTAAGTCTVSAAVSALGPRPAAATFILAVGDSPDAHEADAFAAVRVSSSTEPQGPKPLPGGVHATCTALTAKPRPATLGKTITLSATVKNTGRTGGTPLGDVEFLDN